MYVAIVLYLFAASIVGLLGRDTAAGFLGMFLLSIVLSPIISLICLFLMRPNKRERLMLAEAKLERQQMRSKRRPPLGSA